MEQFDINCWIDDCQSSDTWMWWIIDRRCSPWSPDNARRGLCPDVVDILCL